MSLIPPDPNGTVITLAQQALIEAPGGIFQDWVKTFETPARVGFARLAPAIGGGAPPACLRAKG
jgi:hypothetical protein